MRPHDVTRQDLPTITGAIMRAFHVISHVVLLVTFRFLDERDYEYARIRLRHFGAKTLLSSLFYHAFEQECRNDEENVGTVVVLSIVFDQERYQPPPLKITVNFFAHKELFYLYNISFNVDLDLVLVLLFLLDSKCLYLLTTARYNNDY